jgi:phosphatidylcholine synthase
MAPRKALMVAGAWGIHLLTASGSVLGLLAINFTAHSDVRGAFAAMAAATVIDSIDGPLARMLRVSEHASAIDGALLDNIIDYLTYVIVPAFVMVQAKIIVCGLLGAATVAGLCLASAYGFCHVEAKSAHFRGFPSYWNLVAFYLFCLGFSRAINTGIVVVLIAMVFVPVRYIYPNRTVPLRVLTLTLGTGWAIVTLLMIPELPHHNPILLALSLVFVVYYFAASFLLDLMERRERRRSLGIL